MTIVVFLGPTLRRHEAYAVLGREATWRPPAQRGDVYAAANRGATIIGLIDGAFGGAPAVLHRELLWALQRGCQVTGAASMGALRAVELNGYGMKGVGAIYADFLAGRLCGDDEVAVAHGPAELGFAPLSEPLVNIRYTLARVRAAGSIPSDITDQLLAIATSLFYADRSWPEIVARYRSNFGNDPAAQAALEWVLENRVDQKAQDAKMLLRHIDAEASAENPPRRPSFELQDTALFADFRRFEDNPFLRGLR